MSGRPAAGGEGEAPRLACYCFEIPVREVTASTIPYVQGRVAARECDCRRLNPTGRCCLPELRRIVAEVGEGVRA